MLRGIFLSLAAMTMAVPALAAEMITKTSPYSVHETVDLLEAAAGLDLPLRVLAYADESGDVHVTYRDPVALSEDHGLAADADYLSKMAGALDKLTSKAIAKD